MITSYIAIVMYVMKFNCIISESHVHETYLLMSTMIFVFSCFESHVHETSADVHNDYYCVFESHVHETSADVHNDYCIFLLSKNHCEGSRCFMDM